LFVPLVQGGPGRGLLLRPNGNGQYALLSKRRGDAARRGLARLSARGTTGTRRCTSPSHSQSRPAREPFHRGRRSCRRKYGGTPTTSFVTLTGRLPAAILAGADRQRDLPSSPSATRYTRPREVAEHRPASRRSIGVSASAALFLLGTARKIGNHGTGTRACGLAMHARRGAFERWKAIWEAGTRPGGGLPTARGHRVGFFFFLFFFFFSSASVVAKPAQWPGQPTRCSFGAGGRPTGPGPRTVLRRRLDSELGRPEGVLTTATPAACAAPRGRRRARKIPRCDDWACRWTARARGR